MARFTKREEPKESESYSDNDSSSESSCDDKKKKHISSSKRKRIKKKRRSSSKKKKESRRKEVSTSNSDTSSSFSSDDDSSVSKRKRNIKRKKYSSSNKKKKSRQHVSDSNSEKADKRLDEQIQERHDRRKKHIQKSFEYLSKLTEVDYDLFTVSTLTRRESKCSDFFKNIADSYPNAPDVSIFQVNLFQQRMLQTMLPRIQQDRLMLELVGQIQKLLVQHPYLVGEHMLKEIRIFLVNGEMSTIHNTQDKISLPFITRAINKTIKGVDTILRLRINIRKKKIKLIIYLYGRLNKLLLRLVIVRTFYHQTT